MYVIIVASFYNSVDLKLLSSEIGTFNVSQKCIVVVTTTHNTRIKNTPITLPPICYYTSCSNVNAGNVFGQVTLLQKTINLLVESIIIPDINSELNRAHHDVLYHYNTEYGSTGIPIPTIKGISFVNSTVTLGTVSTEVT